jgi:hypothetical protein
VGRRPKGGREVAGGGTSASVALCTGAAAAIRYDGKELPSWLTAAAALTVVDHGGRVPRGPQPGADRWRSPYRCGSRRLEVRPPWR